MSKKAIIFLIALLMLVLFIIIINAQASLGTFFQDEKVNLIQICDNCSFVNISNIVYPDSSIELLNIPMTKNGNIYNYTFTNTRQTGTYQYATCGDLNNIITCNNVNFEIKPLSRSYGKSIFSIDLSSTTNIIIIIFLGLTSLLLFIGKSYLFSGALTSLLGMMLLFNGINFLISAIVITSGVVIAFKK